MLWNKVVRYGTGTLKILRFYTILYIRAYGTRFGYLGFFLFPHYKVKRTSNGSRSKKSLLKSLQATSDEITIMWSPPTSNSILVRGYTIGWGKGIPDEYTKVVDNKQRYFVIDNLSEYSLLRRLFSPS